MEIIRNVLEKIILYTFDRREGEWAQTLEWEKIFQLNNCAFIRYKISIEKRELRAREHRRRCCRSVVECATFYRGGKRKANSIAKQHSEIQEWSGFELNGELDFEWWKYTHSSPLSASTSHSLHERRRTITIIVRAFIVNYRQWNDDLMIATIYRTGFSCVLLLFRGAMKKRPIIDVTSANFLFWWLFVCDVCARFCMLYFVATKPHTHTSGALVPCPEENLCFATYQQVN